MAPVVFNLAQRGLIRPPSFLPPNVMYETLMGSLAYAVSDDESDRDLYGFEVFLSTTVTQSRNSRQSMSRR